MRLWDALRTRLRSLFFRDRRETELHEELECHLAHETERLVSTGLPRDVARREALRTFGGVEPMAEACRDARGTAALDALVRDLRFAGRSFRRTPLVAATIVTTVGLGLGLVTMVFTILNAVVFRVDAVRAPHELFAVERLSSTDAPSAPFTRPQYEAFVRETGVFTAAFAMGREIDAWIDGRRMEGPLVTGNFFEVLGVSAARGRTFTPADDRDGVPPVLVLSHRAWSQYFASDPDVVGRTIRVDEVPFRVIGVMPERFRGLTVMAPDFWAPLSVAWAMRRSGSSSGDAADLTVVGRLTTGMPQAQALASLHLWDTERVAQAGADRPASPLTLEPRLGTVPQPVEAMLLFVPLFFVFGLVLMIGCSNVANLLLARGVARQREIGVRLAIGASRRRIIGQLLTENLVLALVSAMLGLGLSRLFLSVFVRLMTSTWAQDFGDLRLEVPPADWRVGMFLLIGAVASTVAFALAPALRTTRLDLVRAMRGEVMPGVRPGRVRDALVAAQVTGSALLLVCAAVLLRSVWAAAAVDPGIRTADVVDVHVLQEERRAAVLDVVRREPSVATVAASRPGGLGGLPAIMRGLGGPSAVVSKSVSPKYFEVLGIDLIRGRGFAESERSGDAAVAVVAERAARELWPDGDPLGQVVQFEADPRRQAEGPHEPPPSGTFVVVGVVKDVAGFRLGGGPTARVDIYLPTDVDAVGTSLTLRVFGDAEPARRILVDRLAAIDPNVSEITTPQIMARLEAYLLGIPFWLMLVLGLLALLLTVSGLFSVLAYLVEQRAREIGVRMALGATRRGIAIYVLLRSAGPVVLGMVLGSGLSVVLSAALLTMPGAEFIAGAVRLFDPLAYVVSLSCIVAACAGAALVPALRAGRIEPAVALRRD